MRSSSPISAGIVALLQRMTGLGLVLLFLSTGPAAMAQTTGKIAGVVTDADFGSGLPGVNVFIEVNGW